MITLQSAPPAKADRSAEAIGGHWYAHEESKGWFPLYKEGGTFTLREARKVKLEGGIVVPSVTTIFKLLYKKQLVDWMKGNVAKAALDTSRQDFGTDEDYIDFVLSKAENASFGAADLGSRIHKAIENCIGGLDYDASLAPYVDAVNGELAKLGLSAPVSESCAGSLKYGYAGRVDLSSAGELAVVDFKSRKSKGKKVGSYDTDQMQLAAYGFALFGNPFFKSGKGYIYAVSTTQPGLITVHEFTGPSLVPAFEAFLGLCHAWRFINNFDPRVTQ